MSLALSPRSEIEQFDQDIVRAERLVAEKFNEILVALRRGEETNEAEDRLRHMREALEVLRTQRRRAIRPSLR